MPENRPRCGWLGRPSTQLRTRRGLDRRSPLCRWCIRQDLSQDRSLPWFGVMRIAGAFVDCAYMHVTIDQPVFLAMVQRSAAGNQHPRLGVLEFALPANTLRHLPHPRGHRTGTGGTAQRLPAQSGICRWHFLFADVVSRLPGRGKTWQFYREGLTAYGRPALNFWSAPSNGHRTDAWDCCAVAFRQTAPGRQIVTAPMKINPGCRVLVGLFEFVILSAVLPQMIWNGSAYYPQGAGR